MQKTRGARSCQHGAADRSVDYRPTAFGNQNLNPKWCPNGLRPTARHWPGALPDTAERKTGVARGDQGKPAPSLAKERPPITAGRPCCLSVDHHGLPSEYQAWGSFGLYWAQLFTVLKEPAAVTVGVCLPERSEARVPRVPQILLRNAWLGECWVPCPEGSASTCQRVLGISNERLKPTVCPH